MSKTLVFLCVIGIAVAPPPPEQNTGGPVNCPPDKVSCLNQTECVFKSYWCDGFEDCFDRSDEGQHCKEYQCPTDYTKCDNKLACIPEIYFCDDFHDCRDNSDESTKNCVTTPAPEVRSYLGRFNNRKTKNVIQKSEAKSKYRNDLLDQLARLISKSRK